MNKVGVREYGRVSEDGCDDSSPPIKMWNLFPLPLNLDWPCDLLCPVEHGEKSAAP